MTTIMQPTMRTLARVVTVPPIEAGFGGPGHTMSWVLTPGDYAVNDPFILLADDRLDMPPGAAVGSEHPHAGFEIATFAVAGSIDDGDEGTLDEGDVLWTTAGRGIIHGEHAVPRPGTRILQLWFALPDADRWMEPGFTLTRRGDAPVRHEPGVLARVYSGTSGAVRAERRERVPITMLDVAFEPGARLEQLIPATHNGFLYVLDGTVRVGRDTEVHAGQVGWLDAGAAEGESVVQFTAGAQGARAVFYAGERQGTPIAPQGPFVGGSRADLMRMGREYLSGRYVRMGDLVRGASGAR